MLGGTIELESIEGQGSIFTIEIPAIASGIKKYESNTMQSSGAFDFLRNRKILIVDDDAMQLSLMKEIFSKYPVEITTTTDASSVRGILENEKFDLVLSDIQMPQIDGFELVRIIRNNNNPEISAIPVVALSGKRDLNPEDFTSKGFTAFHPKPLQLDELLLLIKAIFKNEKFSNTKIRQNENTGKLFDLKTLNQFTQNDPHALKMIVQNFIESTQENCAALNLAAAENDLKKLSETAHKMIPMFRQMEVHSIVDLLEPLEDQKLHLEAYELKNYVANICRKIDELVIRLKIEIQ